MALVTLPQAGGQTLQTKVESECSTTHGREGGTAEQLYLS